MVSLRVPFFGECDDGFTGHQMIAGRMERLADFQIFEEFAHLLDLLDHLTRCSNVFAHGQAGGVLAV